MEDAGLSVLTHPAVEPVTLAQAKAQVRVELSFTADDAYLAALITAARVRIETDGGCAMINTAYRLTLPAFPLNKFPTDGDIILPMGPVVELDDNGDPLTAISYTDTNGDDQTLTLGTDYAVSAGRFPARLSLLGTTLWPLTAVSPNAVRVDFTAGRGESASDVPAPLRQGILMLVGHWYERRELVVMGRSAPTPLALEWLLGPFYDGRY